jgi:hypothetical protein
LPVYSEIGVHLANLTGLEFVVSLQTLDETIKLIALDGFGLHVTDFLVQQSCGIFASRCQNAQHRAPVKPREAFAASNTVPLDQQCDNLRGLFKIHAQSVQGLRFAHCFATLQTAIALDNAVVILETTEFLGFTITAITRHLILSGLSFIVTLYLSDTSHRLRPLVATPLVHASGVFVFVNVYSSNCPVPFF